MVRSGQKQKKIIEGSTTNHQYLDIYPVNPTSKKLIVGTIHPHDHDNFELPFFYGNKSSLWKILQKAFPEEFGETLTLEGIIRFLHKHRISVSDTVVSCRRLSNSALDNDLEPLELNTSLVEQIRNSEIEEVLFMSGFQKNSAFKLFYKDMLGLKITDEIRKNREVILPPSIFGRPVKLSILYSPSGAANVAFATSKMYQEKKHLYRHSRTPVWDFKIDYYREKFI